jgi:hypothetical protein
MRTKKIDFSLKIDKTSFCRSHRSPRRRGLKLGLKVTMDMFYMYVDALSI